MSITTNPSPLRTSTIAMKENGPMIEQLEIRQLLSGNPLARLTDDGILHVNGWDAARNTITVGYNADKSGIVVNLSGVTRIGVTKTFTHTFAASDSIRRLHVRGGALDDTITIDQTNFPFDIVTRIEGRDGNDTINAGDEVDRIHGGRGNDIIHAGGGGDLIYGSKGDDEIFGEDGNDTLWGGLGDDIVNGGAGSDKLGGVLGNNEMIGGDGADTFVVKTLADNPTNDYQTGEDILRSHISAHNDETDPPPLGT